MKNTKKENAVNYGTDWKNVDLSRESRLNLLDPYSFDTLLLEISCNLKEINEKTVLEQAQKSLESKLNCMSEILRDNLSNITKEAQRQRAIK